MTRALSRIRIEGYRSLREVELSPGRVTVLVGPNGAGKSNLLSFMRMVSLMRTQSLRRFVGEAGGASALVHYGPRVTREIQLRLEYQQDTGSNAYEVRLGYAAPDALIFLDERVEFRGQGQAGYHGYSLGAGHGESRLDEEAKDPKKVTEKTVRWWLAHTNFFHFHDTSMTSALRQNSRQEDVRFLRPDGSNLAAFLRSLEISEAESHRKSFSKITRLTQRVAPFIKLLQPALVAPEKPEASTVRLDWVDERDQTFGPHQLSDGTLRAIALFTALAQPVDNLPAFISIDEPELGLHPAALEVLASLVRSISVHSQVLLATQSPALLELFEPEDIVIAERSGGQTVLRRLDPKQLASWLEDYTLSELYDKNVLGGRP